MEKIMRTPHSSTNKGKRVKITMRDGLVVIGKFYDKKSGTILLNGTIQIGPSTMNEPEPMRIHMKDVRAFSIYKPTCTQTK
jgi:hypothetical protein